jgi:hypothetical protein
MCIQYHKEFYDMLEIKEHPKSRGKKEVKTDYLKIKFMNYLYHLYQKNQVLNHAKSYLNKEANYIITHLFCLILGPNFLKYL